MASKQKGTGCGCANIPISLVLLLLGVGYWGSRHIDFGTVANTVANLLPSNIAEALPWSEEEAAEVSILQLIANPKVKNVLIFPTTGKPEEAAVAVKKTIN